MCIILKYYSKITNRNAITLVCYVPCSSKNYNTPNLLTNCYNCIQNHLGRKYLALLQVSTCITRAINSATRTITYTNNNYVYVPSSMLHLYIEMMNKAIDTNLLVAVKHSSTSHDFQNNQLHTWCSPAVLEDK